ncbi:MAG TPA: DNA recombination protein RmuC [Spirochaetota bacterium]|nr:DNA recombination protein RmuC [Spirochaetota bacterium]HPP50354.1 DNA recombination protein RmuC [Spirochaetota bacterium]
MDYLLLAVFGALVLLIILVILLLLRNQPSDITSQINAALANQFLALQSSINNELHSARQEIAASKDTIAQHTLKTIETIKEIGQTIHTITQQQEEAQRLGQSLKDLLQAPKLRGNYGEAILEEMLERVLPKGIWETQYTIDGREKVDAVVKIKDMIIPIDAKFPRDNYQKYLNASTEEEKRSFWNAYVGDIKKQIKSIKEKYIKPEKGTSEFALIFIPSEAIYYETIAEKNYLGMPSDLYEFAQDNKVIPVSPNTFYAFLQLVVVGSRNVEIIKKVKHIQNGLLELERLFELFFAKYEEIGKNIEKAAESYRMGDSHIKRYRLKLENTLKLEEFSSDDLPVKKD